MKSQRMFASGVIALCLAPSFAAAPRRLNTFPDLMSALKSGRSVRTVIEYAKCKLVIDGKEAESVDAIGGMKLETWEYFAKGVVRNEKAYVAVSETKLIAHPRQGYVLNYVRLRIYEDNRVEITARYLNPTTYAVTMDETFTGQFSNGKDKNAVSFFAE